MHVTVTNGRTDREIEVFNEQNIRNLQGAEENIWTQKGKVTGGW